MAFAHIQTKLAKYGYANSVLLKEEREDSQRENKGEEQCIRT